MSKLEIIKEKQSAELALVNYKAPQHLYLLEQTISDNPILFKIYDIDIETSTQIAKIIDEEKTIHQIGLDIFNNDLNPNLWLNFMSNMFLKAGITGRKEDVLLDTHQQQFIQKYLWKRCGSYTVSEVLLAIEKNTFGDYPVRVKHYNLLSIEFIGECITQYQNVKGNYFKLTNKIIEGIHIQGKEVEKKLSWEANKDDNLQTFLMEQIELFKNGKLDMDYAALNYDVFSGNNLLEFSTEEKNSAMELSEIVIEKEIKTTLNREYAKKLRYKLSNEVSKNKLLITESKKILYLKFLEIKILEISQ